MATSEELIEKYKPTGSNLENIDQIAQMGTGGGQEPKADPVNNNTPTPAPVQDEKEESPQNLNPIQQEATGIEALVASGNEFNETDAKNFAYSRNEKNWQQYVGGVGGKANPNYIGHSNWKRLQTEYTPYQLEKATIRNKDGIYWNPEVNITDFDAVDPNERINSDTEILAGIVRGAKGEADVTVSDKEKNKTVTGDIEDNKQVLIDLLNSGDSVEETYNELFKTPEIKDAEADVIQLQADLDEYDQQLEELKGDIRREVEGEASESKINAMAAIRGDKILKLKRSKQRDFDTAMAQYKSLREEASNLLEARTADKQLRFNQLFQMIQMQAQEQGAAFNREVAKANIMMTLPEGTSIKLDNETITGIKETDDNMYGELIDASNNLYIYSYNKKTGEKEMTYIGKARGTGGGTVNNYQYELKEYEAERDLEYYREIDQGLADGTIGISTDDEGNQFYYDKESFDKDWAEATDGWWSPKKNPKKIDYMK